MLIRLSILFLIAIQLTSVMAQDIGTVVTRGPLRGTAEASGIVTAFLESGDKFEVIRQQGPWYLLQTNKYVGWMHGNFIRIDVFETLPDLSRFAIDPNKPRPTNKPVTGSGVDSPFREEYVGGTYSTILISNSSKRVMTLSFGGVKYVLKDAERRTITVDGGNYEFTASAPGVRSKTGVREFKRGYKYTWDFFVITVRR